MATKMIKMTVSEYIEQHSDVTRKEVYKMIADGKLKATKVKGAWIIEIAPEKKVKEYTVRQFVEEYNKKHLEAIITVNKVRELAADAKIKAKKVAGKWVILESPSKKIKY